MQKELVKSNAAFIKQWRDFNFVDQFNPQEAINALQNHEDFDGDTSHEESWFATAKIDGFLCAVWGNGSMSSEHTEIQYDKIAENEA